MNANPNPSPLIDLNADGKQRNWAQLTHLVGLLSAAPGVVFVGALGTGAMWLARRGDGEFMDDHGREAMNFQITIFTYSAAAMLAGMILDGWGAPLMAVGIAALTLFGGIRGAIAAGRNEYYRYPMCIRFLCDGDNAAARARRPAPY